MITQENIPYTADEIKAMIKTIEELRKKYNGALERAKVYHTGGSISDAHITEVIFPELKVTESEDERIRKCIIELVKQSSEILDKQNQNNMIAWLEKQNPSWGEKDKNLLNRLIGVLDGTNEEDYHEAWEETFLPWLKSIKERMQIQPKQSEQPTDRIEPNSAWCEEDEEMLKWLCRIIHSQRIGKAITLKEETELGEWMDKWLNHNPQTKQSEHLENCDEDERIRKEIVGFITSSNKYGTNERCEAWLTWLEKQRQEPKKVSIWKHWEHGIAGNGEGKQVYLIRTGNTYSLSSCLGFECDYIELSELDKLTLEKQGEKNINHTDIKEKAHQIAWETSKDYDPSLSKEAWCEMAALDMASWLEKQGEQKPTIPKWKYKKDHTPLLRDSIILNKYGCVAKSPSGAIVSDVWVLDYDELAKLPKEVLEKQGEQKPILDFKASDWYVSKVDRKIHNMCYSVDKVEPKFNVGDWVVLTAGELSTTLQIVNVDTNKKLYWFNDDSYLPIVDEECLHLWTIQDAKDGDVLVDEYNNIGLYSGEKDDLYWHSCIYLGCDDCLRGAMGYHKRKNTKPATKEQRDLLFSKMKEAGYEWRQEEKKIIKMKETKFKVGDWVVNSTTLNLCHILKVEHGQYICDDCSFPITHENEYHLWTIQDAKKGDVLASGDVIFIFNNIHGVWVRCHCSLRKDGSFKDRNYDLMYAKDSKEVYPATKEQRDLLFEKMKEAGYEWDAEKKALSRRDMEILPEAKMQAYIKYCNDKSPSNIFCDKCNKSVTIERQYPYFYDKDENDVYFASICPECGELLITKE